MSTIYQRDILKELARGAVIRVDYISRPVSSKRRLYTLSSTEQRLRESLVQQMVADRLLKPNADELLGSDGPPQSYSLFRASEGGA